MMKWYTNLKETLGPVLSMNRTIVYKECRSLKMMSRLMNCALEGNMQDG